MREELQGVAIGTNLVKRRICNARCVSGAHFLRSSVAPRTPPTATDSLATETTENFWPQKPPKPQKVFWILVTAQARNTPGRQISTQSFITIQSTFGALGVFGG